MMASVRGFFLTPSQTDYNYHRALIWTAVMTALSHLDPAFGSVVAIEAVNEPIMDATQTPGYGDCTSIFYAFLCISASDSRF